MNKWRITFIFLTGFMLHEVLAHIWFNLDGLLPYTSKLFGITITTEMNLWILAVDFGLLLICVYFGFLRIWEKTAHTQRHA